MADPFSHRPQRSPWGRVASSVVLLTVIISVVVTAFAWPAARSSVHDVPIAVAGPPAETDQVVATLRQRLPGAFEIRRLAGTAAAEAAIRDREVYGAIDLTGGKPTVLIASAASPVVAQGLQTVAAAFGGSGAPAVPVRDLAALPSGDPRGAGLAAGALPLVIAGMIAAVLLTRRVRGAVPRLAGALAFAVTGGLAMTAILQFWLGSLAGSYWANTGAVALAIAATSMVILGFEALLGTVGFAIGAALMVLVGNPLSGMTSAPEMLPGWSGRVGQALPPGAAGRLLRSTAFVDGHDATRPVIVLTAWLVAGALLVAAAGSRNARRSARRQAAETPAAPATPLRAMS